MSRIDRPGIRFRETPGHGYVDLSPERQAAMPAALRVAGASYEEDCDWALVVIAFQDEYSHDLVADALAVAKHYHPDRLIAYGIPVAVEESHILTERAFAAAHEQDWVGVAAVGSWHSRVPAGMVGVTAYLGGRDANGHYGGEGRYYLVPADEYNTRGGHGFVIDPSRHQRIDPITTAS